jgi:F-type H+-transporting ATPase subunit a
MNPLVVDPARSLFVHAVVPDSAAAVPVDSAGHGEAFDFSHLLEHIEDSPELETPFGPVHLPSFPPIEIGGVSIDLSITRHVIFLILSAVILLVLGLLAARSVRKNPVPRGLSNALEVVIVFIRDEIAIPNMGQGGVAYVPYLITTFFLILIMNLFGLIPLGATATGNLAVTGGLAVIAFVMIQVSAIRANGIKNYFAHLTGGTPLWLWPIMVPIEIIGLFTKPFALCMRLFANMTGGHIVILALLGFIFFARSFLLAPIPVVFVVGIYLLELLVALIQAYIFTMLTSLFMGLGMVHEEHAEAEHHH